MRKLSVLVYGDVDLNYIDGSSVWLTSMIKMLAEGENILTDVLLKSKMKHRLLVDEMSNVKNTKIIDPRSLFPNYSFENGLRMNVREAVEIIQKLDEKNHYHVIIVRGLDLVNELKDNEVLSKKTIPYITNFEHDASKISMKEKRVLQEIYQRFPRIFMQTPEMRRSFSMIIEQKPKKVALLYPMIPNITKTPVFRNKNSQIVYTGKFAADWYIEELLDIFEKLKEYEDGAHLAIAGDKFQGELINKKEEIIKRLETSYNLTWYGAVSRQESQEIIASSDVGFSYRSDTIDSYDSVELSTKLLEYGRLGKPVICRPTRIHQKLLGKDYPLFVSNEKECIEKIRRLFNDIEFYHEVSKQCFDAVQPFTFENSYQRLNSVLWSFYKKPIKLLVAGHDLKFLDSAITAWKNDRKFDVKIDHWQGHNKHNEKESKELLEWADIIFCEWGLGNAVWYSTYKKQHQKLIVRLHAQEVKTVYPKDYLLKNIDQFIVISPLMYEKFHDECQLPKEKLTTIYNMIDTSDYTTNKDKNAQYHIGMVGILPELKRIDRALDIIEKLIEIDNRYKLFIKSKLPKDLDWMKNRPEELNYYTKQFERIENSHLKKHVYFDKHGSDMNKWFEKIGVVLSTSDNESFHLGPMEGMAAGSVPCVINWEGAQTIYPTTFIRQNTDEMVQMILKLNEYVDIDREGLANYPKKYFNSTIIIKKLKKMIINISEN
ncbi:glycosyltransferase [Enterococcus sp. AZ126]|uniref:glycosyltransferase n=1 Tax=Enterococcus sp. AZ126 TaxID=2774635 RepID=UPI003F1EFC05